MIQVSGSVSRSFLFPARREAAAAYYRNFNQVVKHLSLISMVHQLGDEQYRVMYNSTELGLYNMTHNLDDHLADVLVNRLGVTDILTPERYAEGYRICDNYQERERQIDMLLEIGQRVDKLVKSPFTAPTIQLARIPAKTAGWDELHGFLHRGYQAFKHMKGADYFLKTITTREKDILHRIFSSHPDPFAIE